MRAFFILALGLTLGWIARGQLDELDLAVVSKVCLRDVPRIVAVRGE